MHIRQNQLKNFAVLVQRVERIETIERHILPGYAPDMWNQYNAIINAMHRTKNVSEDWHNHFQVIIGNHHPDSYIAIGKF